jgi:hypothetical protein
MIDRTEDAIIDRMKDIDARFRAASGLRDRRDYSIFYSRLRPSRVMVIGINPGGSRDGTHHVASPTFYENDEHEYVDQNYRIAAVMRPALMHALGTTRPDDLRGVPKTNCVFDRSVGTDAFTGTELRARAALCAPFLAEMIVAVGPDVLIMEGAGARDLFVRHHCRNVREDVFERITGLRRGATNTFFKRETALLDALEREATILTLGHPSQFGHLPTWTKAVEALRSNLGPEFLPGAGESSAEMAGAALPVADPEAGEALSIAPPERASGPIGRSGAMRTRTNDGRTFTAATRPPASFGYRPIHDFWQELLKTGGIGVDAFYDHLTAIGWRRPSGRPLTPQVVRTDLVSMVKNGFAKSHGSR